MNKTSQELFDLITLKHGHVVHACMSKHRDRLNHEDTVAINQMCETATDQEGSACAYVIFPTEGVEQFRSMREMKSILFSSIEPMWTTKTVMNTAYLRTFGIIYE